MNIAFAVQGEGRGHMTQALAVRDWCRRRGHRVVAVLAGAHPNRPWPAFFERGFEVPVTALESPGFVYRRERRVHLPASLWQLVSRIPAYRRSLRELHGVLEDTRPDVLFNFLEPLAGLYRGGKRVPVLAIGHQYMLAHPEYPRLDTMRMEQWGLRRFVAATGNATLRYALSFYEARMPEQGRTLVAPPLLRDELLQRPPGPDAGHYLVYLLNAGYLPEVERWAARRPGNRLHVFCERPEAAAEEERPNGVTVHRLDARKFVELMTTARGVVCSAGFESLSEAAWLGKPALAVPVEGHVEQRLNAEDVQRAGLGVASGRFDLDLLDGYRCGGAQARFQDWVRRSDDHLDEALRRVLGGSSERSREGSSARQLAGSAV